jgi:hypothetical protein
MDNVFKLVALDSTKMILNAQPAILNVQIVLVLMLALFAQLDF